jgi:hypothetical protein
MDSKLLSSDGKEILTWVGEQSDTIFDHYNALGDAEYSKGKRDEAAKSYNQTIQLDALYKSMPMTLTPETEGVTYAQGKIDAFNQMFPANTYAQKTSSAEGANGAVYYQSAGSTEQWVLVSDGKSNKFVDMSVGVLHEARDTTGNLANLLNDNPGNDVEVTILSTNQKVWMEQSAFDAGKTF